MKTQRKNWLVVAGALALATACGSGAGSSASDVRALTGSVASNAANLKTRTLTSDDSVSCAADTVIATDTSGETIATEVEDDCSFTLELEVDKTYSVGFVLDDVFVASLVFDSGSGIASASLPISDDSTTIDLGTVTFSGRIATPENEPLEQCDHDHDGSNDYDDSDDDNDEIDDDFEDDCDLDGVLDDYDDDSESCSTDASVAQVLQVKPHHHDLHGVGETKNVWARIGCEVDESSVNGDTFTISDSEGNEIECDFTITNSESGQQKITCQHDESFAMDTDYTISIDGITCTDGREVEAAEWQFTTSRNAHDDGIDHEFEFENEVAAFHHQGHHGRHHESGEDD
jgi:hypothetical protein